MKRLLALPLLALPLAAQTGPPGLSGCFARSVSGGAIGDRSLTLGCSLSEGLADYRFAVEYGDSNGVLDRRTFNAGGSGSLTFRNFRLADADPGETLFIGPIVSNSDQSVWTSAPTCPVTCTNCDSGDDAVFGDNGSGASGINCVEGENWRVDMAALDEGAPVAPTAPSHSFSAITPDADATTSTNGTCSDFASVLATAEAAAESDGLVHRILVPPNVRCPAFELDNLAQGRVQIAPNVAAELLPPPGTRVHAGYYPYMGLIAHDPAAPEDWTDSLISAAESGANGYDLIAMRFSTPPGVDPEDYPESRGGPVQGCDCGGGGANSNSIRYDRVAFDFPSGWDIGVVINYGGAEHIVIRDSDFQYDATDEASPGPGGIYLGGGRDWQILNNSFRGDSPLFADTASINLEDLTIAGNDFHVPSSHNKNHPDTDGVYRRFGFCVELKSGPRRAKIEGNTFHGCRQDFNPNGPAVAITGVGEQTADVSFRYNTIKNSAGGLMFAQNFGSNSTRPQLPTVRVAIEGNLFHALSTRWRCGGSGCSQANHAGTSLWFWDAMEDTVVKNNIFHPFEATRPQIVYLGGARSQGLVIENNAMVVSRSSSGLLGVRALGCAVCLPALTECCGAAAFEEVLVRGASTDPLSSFATNLILGGIESSNTGAYAVKAASTEDDDTFCPDEVAAESGMDFSGLTFVGASGTSCDESLKERLALAFHSGTYQLNETYAAFGPTMDTVEANQGKTLSVSLTVDEDGADIDFTAPATTGCKVQLAPWDTNYAGTFDDEQDIVEQTATGGDRAQTVTFDSGTTGALDPETKYGYRIQCAKEKMGTFTTAGVP